MLLEKTAPVSLALFCKVVDNFGDVGICWRLSRQLQREHGVEVTLWVDNLHALQQIWPEAAGDVAIQTVAGVTVRHWDLALPQYSAADVADIVIEFFGCDIPESYIAAMVLRTTPPVWLNLEGLSAEEWVEGCHTLSSPHPRLPLTKYFFFPGFTAKTGGLLQEGSLQEQRRSFQSSPAAMPAFLERLGVTAVEAQALKVSLFCYPHAPVAALFEAWRHAEAAVTCLVPEGVAVEAVEAFLGTHASPGASMARGALTVRVVPFLAQTDYDRLLWCCDVNFVRGEDSFVRAQWAGKPFIWHIYPQDKNLHHVKLRAFLQRYASDLPALVDASLLWNRAELPEPRAPVDWPTAWRSFQAGMPAMEHRALGWLALMQANGNLSTNMLKFAASIESKTAENRL